MIHHDWFSLFCLVPQNGYHYYLNKVDINAQMKKRGRAGVFTLSMQSNVYSGNGLIFIFSAESPGKIVLAL